MRGTDGAPALLRVAASFASASRTHAGRRRLRRTWRRRTRDAPAPSESGSLARQAPRSSWASSLLDRAPVALGEAETRCGAARPPEMRGCRGVRFRATGPACPTRLTIQVFVYTVNESKPSAFRSLFRVSTQRQFHDLYHGRFWSEITAFEHGRHARLGVVANSAHAKC